jgi:hypothetical protein
MERTGTEIRPARRSISVSIVVLVMRHSSMLMLLVTHEMRLWMAQRAVHFWYEMGNQNRDRARSDIHACRSRRVQVWMFSSCASHSSSRVVATVL